MDFVVEAERGAAVGAQAHATELAVDETEHEEPPQLIARQAVLPAGGFCERGPVFGRARNAAV